ncbi:TPR-like protein [Punctularia strigosozonata HHB-11173 SS5]|uniref:TPR-like protein n=1 Tax=Punctularia strigosozonata (strain HHB-11173) TaxID=741275 RepID=UPI00044169D2|nr:TPR-like protein [Punctularia strigosozonata HHB-11173 SS5]EIN05645.1 TPR-like protein [Punctularia strigosozonata HHB-11173 SS5]
MTCLPSLLPILADEEEDGTSEPSESGESSQDDDAEGETDDEVDPAAVAGTQGETEIDNDFDRLVADIRQLDRTSNAPAGVLTKTWDINIEDQDAAFRDDLRLASGIGARRRKGQKRGRRSGPVLSQQVRALIGEGNQAFVDNNIEEAIRIMQEVIRIEPRASSAWSVLARCYTDIGDDKKSLQFRIMAAHLKHDPEEWDELAKQSREMGYMQQALYCYRKIYSLDPDNVHALWERASLAKEVGDVRAARHSLLALLRRIPHDLTVLDELRPLLIETSELDLCAKLFADAFEHYQSLYPAGSATDPETGAQVPGGGFGLMDILVLADLYNSSNLKRFQDAVRTIKRGCRWLQGRALQKYWDAREDDSEYDLDPRNAPESVVLVPRDKTVEPGHYPLDVNARHRLGVARLKMGDLDEGKMHVSIVLCEDVMDYAPLFGEIADVYFEREMYAEARPIYETLGMDAGTSSMYILLQTAACRRMLGELPEAAEVYEHVISMDPTHNDAKLKLAEIYEILNEPRKALDLVYQVIDSRRQRYAPRGANTDSQNQAEGSLFAESAPKKQKNKGQPRMSNAQLGELEARMEKETTQSYQRLKELWPDLRARLANDNVPGGEQVEREWMHEAAKMVESFRETRQLFTSNRQGGFRGMFKTRTRPVEDNEDSMASRLQLDLAFDSLQRKAKGKDGRIHIFRGLSFDDWLSVFMQYTFILAKRNQYALADEILNHISLSVAYQKQDEQDTIRLSLITIAVVARQFHAVVRHARKLIITHQFNNEPIRILMASLGSGIAATDAFIAQTFQKHLLRELKLHDTAVHKKELIQWHGRIKRFVQVSEKLGDVDDEGGDEDPEIEDADDDGGKATGDAPPLPSKPNPMGVTVYGQICCAAKSYQSAIFYLLHAVDYSVDDPVICLSMVIASLGRAMQRQADNRNHLLAQAFAFLSKYRQLRADEAEDEVEYNFGRAFQQLGLHSLAVRHYERVLEIVDHRRQRDDKDYGVAREAAYNLCMIYVTTGASPLAKGVMQKWLSI